VIFLEYLYTNTTLSNLNKLVLTDWLVIRHIEQKTAGSNCSLSDTEFNQLHEARNKWRSTIISSILSDFSVHNLQSIIGELQDVDSTLYNNIIGT
jgi:hypothetical protein